MDAMGDAWVDLVNVEVEVQRGHVRLVPGPWTQRRVCAPGALPAGTEADTRDAHNLSARVYVRPAGPGTTPWVG